MTTPSITQHITQPTAVPLDVTAELSGVSGALWLLGTAILCLMAVYFIGLDQGMTSVFGNNSYVHELVHDGRHFLGFPCH